MADPREVLTLSTDPATHPQEFKQELLRILNRINEVVIFLKKNLETTRLQAYNPDDYEYYDVLGLGEIDRLTSTDSTLVLSDDGTNQTITGDLGDITIVPNGGDVAVTGTFSATNITLVPTKYTSATVAKHGKLGAFAKDTVYQNKDATMRVVQISVKISG